MGGSLCERKQERTIFEELDCLGDVLGAAKVLDYVNCIFFAASGEIRLGGSEE